MRQMHAIYAFLNYIFRSGSIALSIIHPLIVRLTSGCDDLQDVLCQSVGEALKSSTGVASNLLTTLLARAGPTYIVIDGMDETDEIERCRLLNKLLEMSTTWQEVKIFGSGRAEADATDLLNDQTSIRVDGRNAGSIQTFANQCSEKGFRICNFCPEAEAEINANAKGVPCFPS